VSSLVSVSASDFKKTPVQKIRAPACRSKYLASLTLLPATSWIWHHTPLLALRNLHVSMLGSVGDVTVLYMPYLR
jgi:hypothetical protein